MTDLIPCLLANSQKDNEKELHQPEAVKYR